MTGRGRNGENMTYRFRVVVVRTSAGANLPVRLVSEATGLVKRLEKTPFYPNVFGASGLLKTDSVKLILADNANPHCVTTARRIAFPLQTKVKEELDRMEKDGVIQKVTTATDHCAPIIPVNNNNNKKTTTKIQQQQQQQQKKKKRQNSCLWISRK